MKILITNIVTLNAGDAAILSATIDLLRKAFDRDIEFIVYDQYGDLPAKYYPEFVFRKFVYFTRGSRLSSITGPAGKLLRSIDNARFWFGTWAIKNDIPVLARLLLSEVELRDLFEYKTADLIVSSGGTYLVENYSLSARLLDYKISLYLGRPLVFFTQSLGPFRTPANRQALVPVFNNSAAILVRDQASLENLKELGVTNTKIHLAADAAFALTDNNVVESIKTNKPGVPNRLKVAISVREWRHFKQVTPERGMIQYQDALRALTKHLVEKYNAEITYLSSCQGMPEYWTDDSKIAQAIVDGLDKGTRQRVCVDSDFHPPTVLASLLRDYDLVVATRMHMAILALGVGTPVLPIAYEFKMRGMFERLGYAEWVQDIETITPETLVRTLDRFLDKLPEIRNSLFSAVQKEHENAVASGQVVRRAFDDWQQAKAT